MKKVVKQLAVGWNYTVCNDDGVTTWDIQWGKTKWNDATLECRTEAQAKEVTALLNKLKIGPDSNFVTLQPWQAEALNRR